MSLLEIRGLTVEFKTSRGLFRAVDGVDLELAESEVLGVVGESGSGKSVSMLAVMGLLAGNARGTAERLAFDGRDLLGLSPPDPRALVGKAIASIFPAPPPSPNPRLTIPFHL